MRLICKILIVFCFCVLANNASSQQKTSCLKDIYGDKFIFNKTDSVVLMVFIKPPACTGCRELLFKFLDNKNLNYCKEIIVYSGRLSIVGKKSRKTKTEDLLSGSRCLFYYKNKCNKENDLYPLFEQCQKSPCIGIFRNGRLYVFDSDEIFVQN